MDDLPEDPPFIETTEQAEMIGAALCKVLRFDTTWPSNVFEGGSLTWRTGPHVLNEELKSMWRYDWTPDQKRKILTSYIAQRLGR